MAFGSELGSAHISVFPSMKGFRSVVNKEVGASGKAASKAFDSSMNGGKSGGLFGHAFKTGFKQSANDFSADVLKSYERDVAKSTAAYRQAMLQQKAAANQVRAAEESVANAIAKHGEGSTQAEAATIRLEQARLKLSTMTDRATQAENRLKDAQKALKDAQDNLASSSGSLGSAFKNLGATIVQPVSGAFGRVKNAATSAFSGIATKARDGMSAAGAAMQSTASRLTAPLSAKFSSMSSAIAARIPAPFKNVSNAIGGYLGNVGGAVGGVLSQIPGAAGSAASAIGSKLKSGADTAWNAISSMSGKAVGALKGVATVGLAGVGTAVAALAGVGKSALDAYATYEQAVGGVDTLFKDASGTVQKYAAEAYRTAGVSANEYMTQVTSFSASLISSLGGDTAKAAELGNTAMVDMSDNANKMGTDIESIQQTYQSLARGNYAMLDNLKLGYGGTKSEMERLIQDANKVKQANGEMGDLSIDKFSDVVQAIHIMQEQMGISGTTAKEAATTIEGSVGMMKAAWQNWLAELGKDNADINGLTKQLVDSVGTVIENVGPRIAQIITGITAALPQLFSSLGSTLPALVMQILPPVLGALGQLGTLSKIPAHGGILGVHRIAAGDKGHHAAGTHLVECFGKKVVVDAEIQLVIGFISNLILAERHITNGKVIEISPVGGLKPGHGDVGLGVELLCNPSTDGIQLHAVQTAVSHFLRQHTKEIAHTHRRLQNISGLKSHTVHRFIDGLNDRRAGVMGVEGRASGGGIFLRGQQFF